MITGSHAIIYAQDPEAARAFFRSVLELPFVDAHEGWLIFKLPPAELGIHPAGDPADPVSGAPAGGHEMFLMCDDIQGTVTELEARGAHLSGPIENQGFGRLVRMSVPGAGEIGLYEPRHQTAYDLEG